MNTNFFVRDPVFRFKEFRKALQFGGRAAQRPLAITADGSQVYAIGSQSIRSYRSIVRRPRDC